MVAMVRFHIEFVCTGNIGRSPYAQRLAASLADPQRVRFTSSGVMAVAGYPMLDSMADQLRIRGVDSEGHHARALTCAILSDADLALTMDAAQRQRVLDDWPGAAPKTFTLAQFLDSLKSLTAPVTVADAFAHRSPARPDGDIADPIGRGARGAARVASQLDLLVSELVSELGLGPPQLLGSEPAPATRQERGT